MLISTLLLRLSFFKALKDNMTVMTILHYLDLLWITLIIAYIIFNVICVILCTEIARGKNRTAIGWFCFALFLFGLSWIPLILIVRLDPVEKKQSEL